MKKPREDEGTVSALLAPALLTCFLLSHQGGAFYAHGAAALVNFDGDMYFLNNQAKVSTHRRGGPR